MRLRALLLLAIAGCSSTVSSVTGGAVGGSSDAVPTPSSDLAAPDTPHIPACPADDPREGEACDDTTNVFACEYGAAAIPDCDRVFECTRASTSNSATWQRRDAHDAICDACPSTIPGGDACSTIGALCTYYEGTCGCIAGADGGAASWTCTKPAAGCPARRPRDGAPCVHEMDCDYGSCLFGVPLAWQCRTRSSFVTAWEPAAAKGCP